MVTWHNKNVTKCHIIKKTNDNTEFTSLAVSLLLGDSTESQFGQVGLRKRDSAMQTRRSWDSSNLVSMNVRKLKKKLLLTRLRELQNKILLRYHVKFINVLNSYS